MNFNIKCQPLINASILIFGSFILYPAAHSAEVDMSAQTSSSQIISINNQFLKIEPAGEEYSSLMFEICDAMGMNVENKECLIYPMVGDLGYNALAAELDGNKVIIYDRSISKILGREGAYSVIAHELGHHYCKHVGKQASIMKELEADIFAGSAMRNLGFDLRSALAGAILYNKNASETHPEKTAREEAIAKGWMDPKIATKCK